MWQWITAINHTNMKNVLSTGITSSSQQPYTKTTHEWYNAMSKDVAEAFVKSLIPSSAYTGKLVILSGCELTGTNPGLRTVSDGWVWYSGEIFRVNAGTFTTGVGEVGVWSINTVATNLTFSDGASKPVHQEKTLVLSNGESGSGLFDENSNSILNIESVSLVQGNDSSSIGVATDYIIQLNQHSVGDYIDANSEFDYTNWQFTPKRKGYYSVSASSYVGAVASLGLVRHKIIVNGSTISLPSGLSASFGSSEVFISGEKIVLLNAGDMLKVVVTISVAQTDRKSVV